MIRIALVDCSTRNLVEQTVVVDLLVDVEAVMRRSGLRGRGAGSVSSLLTADICAHVRVAYSRHYCRQPVSSVMLDDWPLSGDQLSTGDVCEIVLCRAAPDNSYKKETQKTNENN